MQLPHDLRQFAVALLVEGELHLALAGLLGLGDVGIVEGVGGAVGLQASNEKITSSAVTGLPSCQRASGRRRKVTEEKSSG